MNDIRSGDYGIRTIPKAWKTHKQHETEVGKKGIREQNKEIEHGSGINENSLRKKNRRMARRMPKERLLRDLPMKQKGIRIETKEMKVKLFVLKKRQIQHLFTEGKLMKLPNVQMNNILIGHKRKVGKRNQKMKIKTKKGQKCKINQTTSNRTVDL